MKLHHIGIVVPKINDSIGDLTKFLKFDTVGIPTLVGSQKVNVCFLKIGTINLELIEPAEKDSPISSFLSNGGGFHQFVPRVARGRRREDRGDRERTRRTARDVSETRTTHVGSDTGNDETSAKRGTKNVGVALVDDAVG